MFKNELFKFKFLSKDNCMIGVKGSGFLKDILNDMTSLKTILICKSKKVETIWEFPEPNQYQKHS